jgi:sporadic carbohydrate cluster protein (TIGR04323 family)
MFKNKNNYYRGYISSRPINGSIIPQSLQNLKIRDYAKIKNLDYKLSITEYRMKKTYYALDSLKKEIKLLRGAILFSIYQLPEDKKLRVDFLNYFIKKKKELFFALEDIKIKDKIDIDEIELIYFISQNAAKSKN